MSKAAFERMTDEELAAELYAAGTLGMRRTELANEQVRRGAAKTWPGKAPDEPKPVNEADFRKMAEEHALFWWREQPAGHGPPTSSVMKEAYDRLLRLHPGINHVPVSFRPKSLAKQENQRERIYARNGKTFFRVFLKTVAKWQKKGVEHRKTFLGKTPEGAEVYVESLASKSEHAGKVRREKKNLLDAWLSAYRYQTKAIRGRKP